MDDTAPGKSADAQWNVQRRRVVRDGLGIGVATGAYALSFGAIATASGLSTLQAVALSTLMFTGASQFAFVGVLGAGGGALAAAATATLLGSRNAFYGLRLASLLRVRGTRRLLTAQLVIDESTAMAIARPDERTARAAFWATGCAIFVFWNLGTLIGALGAEALNDPRVLGLDAAAPAAFLALLAPQLRDRQTRVLAVAAVVLALLITPVLPAGLPILVVAAVTVLVGLRRPNGTATP